VKTIGIDPGLGGAIALHMYDSSVDLVVCHDMPVIKVGNRRRLNIASVVAILREWRTIHGPLDAALEHVSARPRQGVVSAFTFGEGFGALEAALCSAGHRMHLVRPATWKRAMRLGKDKHASRIRATEYWPEQWELFQRTKDDGRAEACLLAAWMRRELNRRNTP